jgi:NADPH:quinone reductase-like Zn-dependent oxidoreductase
VVALKPSAISHAEAAPVCDGAMTVLYMLHDLGEIKVGQKVLINGAAGSLGNAAVQIAHDAGARVVGVCSKRNFDFVRSLGAESVIDYNDTDISQIPGGYDIIFDSVGKLSHRSCKRLLHKTGRFISPALSLPLLFGMLLSKCKFSNSPSVMFAATGLLPEEAALTASGFGATAARKTLKNGGGSTLPFDGHCQRSSLSGYRP